MNTTSKNGGASGARPEGRRTRRWLVPAIVLMAASCTGETVKKGPVDVKGLVTIDGKPLVDASVGLFPDVYGTGRACMGKTDKTGAFSLQTYVDSSNTVPGVDPGSYHAIVTKLAKVQPRDGGIKSDIPTRYADVHTSDLKVVVSEEPNQTVTIELQSK